MSRLRGRFFDLHTCNNSQLIIWKILHKNNSAIIGRCFSFVDLSHLAECIIELIVNCQHIKLVNFHCRTMYCKTIQLYFYKSIQSTYISHRFGDTRVKNVNMVSHQKHVVSWQYCFSNHVCSLAGTQDLKTRWLGFSMVNAAICRKITSHAIDAANKTETIEFIGIQSFKWTLTCRFLVVTRHPNESGIRSLLFFSCDPHLMRPPWPPAKMFRIFFGSNITPETGNPLVSLLIKDKQRLVTISSENMLLVCCLWS